MLTEKIFEVNPVKYIIELTGVVIKQTRNRSVHKQIIMLYFWDKNLFEKNV